MNNQVREKLGVLVQRYRDTVEEEPQRIISALRDYCATSKEEIHVLDVAIKAGVLVDLLSSSTDVLGIRPTIMRCTQKVVALGISENKAKWAVESWALGFGRIANEELSLFISDKEEKFREAIEATLADKILTPEEKSYLLLRARNFDISKDEAEIIISELMSKAGMTGVSTSKPQSPSQKVVAAPAILPTQSLQQPSAPVPTNITARSSPFWTKGKKNILIVFVISIIGLCIYSVFFSQSNIAKKIDSALKNGNYFSPPGDNVEEIYRALYAKSPNSSKTKDAAKQIFVNFSKEGDAAFAKLYADSDDSGWDVTVKMYAFLNEIMPGDKEIMARSEFSLAHSIIRSMNVSEFSSALKHYERALDLKQNWVFPINGIAKIYVLKNSPYYNRELALNWYNRVCGVDPNFPWAYSNIAAIYSEEYKWPLAEEALLKAVKIKSNRSSFYKDLGIICEKQQKLVEAKNYYQNALKFEKNSEMISWLQNKIDSFR
jgi:tetratricopeptide (TPR) repeat protein